MDPSAMIDELKARQQALCEASYTLPFSLDDELPQRGEAGNQFVKRCAEWRSHTEAAIQAGLKLFECRICHEGMDKRVDVIGSIIYLKELIGKPVLKKQLEEAVAAKDDVDLASRINSPPYQAARACIDLQRKALNVIDELTIAIERLDSLFLPRLRLGEARKHSNRELHVEVAGRWRQPRSIKGSSVDAIVSLRDKGFAEFIDEKALSRFRKEVRELAPHLKVVKAKKDKGKRVRRTISAVLRERILPDA